MQVFWVILLFDINTVLTIVQPDITIVVPWQLSTGNKHDYLFCYFPLVGILFKVMRIDTFRFHAKCHNMLPHRSCPHTNMGTCQ